MGPVTRSKASLRISGSDLTAGEITKLLGCEPTFARTKGLPVKPGSNTLFPTGGWSLQANESSPEDLNGQIMELLDKLTQDLEVWASIGRRFHVDLFCGLFMEQGNQGASLSVESLRALSCRGIELSLNIYAP